MTHAEIISALRSFFAASYPDIVIRIEPWRDDPGRDAIYFEEENGDFRLTKRVLGERGFDSEAIFDVCHVLMFQGGYCDSEVLYNVVEESRLKAAYWSKRNVSE